MCHPNTQTRCRTFLIMSQKIAIFSSENTRITVERVTVWCWLWFFENEAGSMVTVSEMCCLSRGWCYSHATELSTTRAGIQSIAFWPLTFWGRHGCYGAVVCLRSCKVKDCSEVPEDKHVEEQHHNCCWWCEVEIEWISDGKCRQKLITC